MMFIVSIPKMHIYIINIIYTGDKTTSLSYIFMPPPFSVGGVGEGAYSITAVRMYIRLSSQSIHPIHPVRNTWFPCDIF